MQLGDSVNTFQTKKRRRMLFFNFTKTAKLPAIVVAPCIYSIMIPIESPTKMSEPLHSFPFGLITYPGSPFALSHCEGINIPPLSKIICRIFSVLITVTGNTGLLSELGV
jgi:hypothetical protein